ncbi:MAG: hypothetical protein K2X32_11180 [Phycisphaerales bacterium]|nr:hypothetical protein [Phycisphaerales bacterium]
MICMLLMKGSLIVFVSGCDSKDKTQSQGSAVRQIVFVFPDGFAGRWKIREAVAPSVSGSTEIVDNTMIVNFSADGLADCASSELVLSRLDIITARFASGSALRIDDAANYPDDISCFIAFPTDSENFLVGYVATFNDSNAGRRVRPGHYGP